MVTETLHLLFSGFRAPIPAAFESGPNAYDAHLVALASAPGDGAVELGTLYSSVDPLLEKWLEDLQDALERMPGVSA